MAPIIVMRQRAPRSYGHTPGAKGESDVKIVDLKLREVSGVMVLPAK